MLRRFTSTLCIALAAAMASACSVGHQEPMPFIGPLVFPGEGRLGSSAMMVIDSNSVPTSDDLERYDLDRDRVAIFLEGNLGIAEANVRSVFSVESGRATIDAELRPNGWVTLVLFDLPTESSGAFSPPYPQHTYVHVDIDGAPVPELDTAFWLIGTGGQPTAIDLPLLGGALEDELEPRTAVRLRARGGSEGFQNTWLIGGISADVDYDTACLANPRAFAGSDAVQAGVTVGPAITSPYASGRNAVKIVLSKPWGFGLISNGGTTPDRFGNGPLLDVTFDRIQTPSCNQPLSSYFSIRSLKVRDVNGTVRVSRPGTTETGFDGSQFFYTHYLDPDRPS